MSSDRTVVAHHEAGHAVIALILEASSLRIEICDEGQDATAPNYVGSTAATFPDEGNQTLNRLVACMAGDVAENIYRKVDPKILVTSSGDIDWTANCARENLAGVDNTGPVVSAAVNMAQALLGQEAIWQAVEALANQLLTSDDMDDKAIRGAVLAVGQDSQ